MDWKVDLLPYQDRFVFSEARWPAMVSAWATGKTMCGIMLGMLLSKEPGNLGLVMRQDYTDLRDSTMNDFEKYTGIKVPTNKDVILPNGSKIMFRHGSELKKLQNINLGWFYIEQAEEFESDQEFQLLRGRLRRVRENGDEYPLKGFVIANTNGHNWIWRNWKSAPITNSELIEATSYDNPYVPKSTVDDWKQMAQDSPAHYRRFIMNSWEDTDTADKCIAYSDLMKALDKDVYMSSESDLRTVVIDPAEFGDDTTVIYGSEGAKVIDEEILFKKEPMETAGRALRMARKIHAEYIGIDSVGIGSGIASRLSELGATVIRINSGSGSSDKNKWKNLKAEMWMNAQEMFRDNLVELPDDDKLVEDLACHTYSIDSKGRVTIERKKDVKKKLGRSPDKGDAFIMLLWLIKKYGKQKPTYDIDEYEDERTMSYAIKTAF